MGTTPPVIETYFRAVNTRDWDAMATALAEDVVLRPVGVPPVRGRDAALAYYPDVLAKFEQAHDEVVRVAVAGDVVTVEIVFTGRTHDGAPVSFDAVDVFDLDAEGRIHRLSLWYDTRGVIRQIRAVPSDA